MILTDHKKILTLLIVLVIWDLVWRGFGLWRAAKQGHKLWFILMLIIETAGILPIIFLLWYPSEKEEK